VNRGLPRTAVAVVTAVVTPNPLLLIAKGLNVVYVSRQLGHANPSITLEVYAHLFARADHAETARDALEASHAAPVGGSG
jgi:hypothetical protein